MDVQVALSDDEIAECFPVMSELRPHIAAHEFVPLVRRLSDATGFRMAFLRSGGEVKCVAGYRISEWLAGGKYLEIEDLVSKQCERSKGYGSQLFDWLKDLATRSECRQVRLVSNVRR